MIVKNSGDLRIRMNSIKPVISVVVPVFNCERFLSRCLDSIVRQTYPALDIILVDDGSSDRSGEICDAYAAEDPRIRVFHTENRGVSAARNLGVAEAMKAPSTYLAFVDSDDWIELNMYEELLGRMEETDADIAVFSRIDHFPEEDRVVWRSNDVYYGFDVIKAYLTGKFYSELWDKLWKKTLFEGIVFPEGRTYEDLARMGYIIPKAKTVLSISQRLYHYYRIEDSLTTEYSVRNLIDYWLAHKERYDVMTAIPEVNGDPELMVALHNVCAWTIARAWQRRWRVKEELTNEDKAAFRKMSLFTRRHWDEFGALSGRYNRYCLFLSRYNNKLSFFLAYLPSLSQKHAPQQFFERK